MILDVVETLQNLVRIPSVNPMGRDLSGDEFYESRLTDRLESIFKSLKIPHERHCVEPRRDNIIARIDGTTPAGQGGKILMLEAHQDTVPVDGMTIEPWSAELKDDRIYGRGSCDIKGGMACMLTAISRLIHDPPPQMPTILMACTINEEHGFSGATHLARLWTEGGSSLLPRAPDAVIVAEPTQLNAVVAHKGVVRWRCHTHGRAAHSSSPQLGDNAIYKMSGVLAVLRSYAEQVAPTLGEHPLVGKPSLSVGTIQGGISVNTVPDHCSIEIDRRLLPGEDPTQAYQHVIQYMAEKLGPEATQHDQPNIVAYGLSDENNGPLATKIVDALNDVRGNCQKIGVPYGTDAAVFSSSGVPAVVLGPGSIDQAHTKDEWIEVEQLHLATDAYVAIAKSFV